MAHDFENAFQAIRRANEKLFTAQLAYRDRRINGEELIAARAAYADVERNFKIACKSRRTLAAQSQLAPPRRL